jgi:hypothetical protein
MSVGDDGGGVTVYNLDELVKLSINNIVAAVPKPAKAAAINEFKPHTDWVTQLVFVDGQVQRSLQLPLLMCNLIVRH